MFLYYLHAYYLTLLLLQRFGRWMLNSMYVHPINSPGNSVYLSYGVKRLLVYLRIQVLFLLHILVSESVLIQRIMEIYAI